MLQKHGAFKGPEVEAWLLFAPSPIEMSDCKHAWLSDKWYSF